MLVTDSYTPLAKQTTRPDISPPRPELCQAPSKGSNNPLTTSTFPFYHRNASQAAIAVAAAAAGLAVETGSVCIAFVISVPAAPTAKPQCSHPSLALR